MQIFEQGSGPPLVLIPGLQGRWEYLRPAVDSLSATFRVITFPLCGEPVAGLRFDPSRGLDNYVDQTAAVLDELHIERAVICGVSFGGLIAPRFAASHPARTRALVLVSPPPPDWRLPLRHRLYLRFPWLLGPLFLAETPLRLRAELGAAFPDRGARRRFVRSQLGMLRTAPVSLTQMARRGRLMSDGDFAADACRVTAPTLVVTGERSLDRVVPVDGSLRYLTLIPGIPGARHVAIERTGHLGSITRPDRFAAIVRDFVESHHHAAA